MIYALAGIQIAPRFSSLAIRQKFFQERVKLKPSPSRTWSEADSCCLKTTPLSKLLYQFVQIYSTFSSSHVCVRGLLLKVLSAFHLLIRNVMHMNKCAKLNGLYVLQKKKNVMKL